MKPGVINDIINFIYPPTCHLCHSRLAPHERYICTGCISDMPRTHYHRRPDNQMEMRFAGLFPFSHAAGHFFYSRGSQLSQLIQDFKYRRFRGLARRVGEVVGEELFTTPFLADVEVIMPIPMHFIKKARRGYNQTEEIANGLAAATGLPVSTDLKAFRPHRTQTRLSHEQRLKNTRGIFRLDNPERYSGKEILLLDDVCTTGATLTSAAESILDACPDSRLSLLTIGVTF